MNKKMRHADRVLSNARNYCQTISQKREENTLRKVVTKLTEQKSSQVQFNSNVKMYKAFNIVKMAKGDFRVQADGQVIERRFIRSVPGIAFKLPLQDTAVGFIRPSIYFMNPSSIS